MKHKWLYLSKTDIETERLQCEQEGRDLSSVEGEFERVLALDLESDANQPAAQALLDRTIQLPLRSDFPFLEPSDLAGIRAARPDSMPKLPALSLSDASLLDTLHGAWTGRCVGCLLGKPVEGWKRTRMYGYLKDLKRWPLSDFFRLDVATPEVREKYELEQGWGAKFFADRQDKMPEDDDTNYTTTGLAVLKRYGREFSPANVGAFWLSDIPLLNTCTAERVAHRNMGNGLEPPQSATYRNPYREWIGAQIRADFWGYVAPGNPQLAAEFAWRDASVSHVKNGIYGEMWVAAMTAAAFATDDVRTIIEAGLAQIPERCRLSDAIESILEWHDVEVDYETAVYRVHELWDEKRAHDWCHTISNAMIVAIGLLWGETDYELSICRAVQACFDTDCNGATVGSILGIIYGRNRLPAKWADHIHDTLETGVAGYARVNLADMARETLALVRG